MRTSRGTGTPRRIQDFCKSPTALGSFCPFCSGRDAVGRHQKTPSAWRSSQRSSSLTGINFLLPSRTIFSSGSISAWKVSQETDSAAAACSTVKARDSWLYKAIEATQCTYAAQM